MKFISEMTPAEMVPHVFGQNYRTDARGRPIEQGRGSEAQIREGKNIDSIDAHLRAMGKYRGADAEKAERERIKKLYPATHEKLEALSHLPVLPEIDAEIAAL